MAGEWIKMRLDLAEDPAVIAMAAALDVDEDLIVGKLHRLWSWADRQSRDGHASGVTEKWIDRFIRLAGFAAAMAEVDWLRIGPNGIEFPNFERHNGETAKTRALGAKRKQKERSIGHGDVPNTSRPQRDKSVTREEKRREEEVATTSTSSESALRSGNPVVRADSREASQALRAAGCKDSTPTDPHLTSALADGITVAELVDLARTKPGKSVAYLCHAARGKRADAASTAGVAPGAPVPIRNHEGPSPRLSRAEEKRREKEALDLMRQQHDEIGLGGRA